jgi:ribulose-phosphate 3-epimerase
VRAIPETFIKDCHLMVDEPLDKVQSYVEAGAGIMTFHVESTKHPHRLLQSPGGTGVIRGVAVNPGTPLEALEPLLDDLELILLLAINPGWSGQKFIPATAHRLAATRELIGGREVVLGVDGGVTRANIDQVAALQPDFVLSGSAISDGIAPRENLQYMYEVLRANRVTVGR